MLRGKWKPREGAKDEESEDEDDSDDEDQGDGRPRARSDRLERKIERWERREVKRSKKIGRMQFSEDIRASAGERWRLVVAYNPPVL